MWELIINAVGWIVGGSLEARANRINRKTGIITSETEKQISEILGSANEEAKKEGTKQTLLNAISAKVQAEKKPEFPIEGVLSVSVLLVKIFFLYRSQKQENG
jgi:ribosomal protein S5